LTAPRLIKRLISKTSSGRASATSTTC